MCRSYTSIVYGGQAGRTRHLLAAAQAFERCVDAVRLLEPARARLLSFNQRRGLSMQVPGDTASRRCHGGCRLVASR